MSTGAGAGNGPMVLNVTEFITIQSENRTLNIYDPPKDLHAGNFTTTNFTDENRNNLTTIIKELFSPSAPLPGKPGEYLPIADTKKLLMSTFGFQNKAGGTYSEWIANKLNSLIILREKHSSGQDPRPTGLYVSQDTGPNDVVTDPKFIITPGTVIDPAGKTKKNPDGTPADYSPIDEYPSLPKGFIDTLDMGHIIEYFKVTKNPENTQFTVELKTTFEGGDNIDVILDGNFEPSSSSVNKDYYKGNPTKNKYIVDYAARLKENAIKKQVKKFLLIKELGDTFQVQWLNYMFQTPPLTSRLATSSTTTTTSTAATAATGGTSRFNRGNTVIITNDTVVFYRSLINKVPVILTYRGNSRFYSARNVTGSDKLVMEAALILTRRKEVIRHNTSVINLIEDVIVKAPTDKTSWIGGVSWDPPKQKIAVAYLRKLKEQLTFLNNDIDIYFNIISTIEAADTLSANSHFIAPFVWCKAGYYKPINTILSLVQDGRIKFTTYLFTKNSLTTKRLTDSTLFETLYTESELQSFGTTQRAGGGIQRGGARRDLGSKQRLKETDVDTKEKVLALLNKSVSEFKEPWGLTLYEMDPSIFAGAIGVQSLITPPVGNAIEITERKKWEGNNGSLHTKIDLKFHTFFLYTYVRDFYPEIFTFAYVVKKAYKYIVRYNEASTVVGAGARRAVLSLIPVATGLLDEGFSNVPDNKSLKEAYDVDGRYNDDNKFLYHSPPDYPDYPIFDKPQKNAAFEGTYEAIALAKFFVDSFPSLQTKHLANFFAEMSYFLLPQVPDSVSRGIGENENRPIEIQQGGGEGQIHPIASMAMDIYEIYYSLAIKGAYEGRNEVTNEELDRAVEKNIGIILQQIESQLMSGMQTPYVKKRSTVSAPFKNKRSTISNMSNNPVMAISFGGKRRYKKTQKKKKRKLSKRNTRKHKH